MSPSFNKGFTLIELMVSIAIMVVITTVVVLNQSKLSEDIGLKNAVQDVSLSMRQAQVYGISVRETEPGSNNFQYGYGLDFDITHPNQYLSFYDKNLNGIYGGGWDCAGPECLDVTDLMNNTSIKSICSMLSLSPLTYDCSASRVDIIFRRPSTQALISFNGAGIAPVLGAKVVFQSETGKTRSLIVFASGNIVVE